MKCSKQSFGGRVQATSRCLGAFLLISASVFLIVGLFTTDVLAQVACTGVPFDKGDNGSQTWYFDTANGTCSNAGPNPTDGFTLRTDDSSLTLANVFNGGVSDDLQSSSPTGVTAANISPNAGHPDIDVHFDNGLGTVLVGFFSAENVTFNFVVTLTFQGVDYTINLTHIAFVISGNHQITSMTVTGGNFIPPPPDTTPPTVAITGVPAEVNGAFEATFTFSEDVTDFDDAGDIEATNATVGAIVADSASVYKAVITPLSTGPVTVRVPAGAATDGTNLSLASDASTSQHTTPQDIARQQIGEYVSARHGLIMANRPAASRRISRFGESGISGGESISAFGMSVANPARFALAFEGNEMAFAMRSDRVAPVLNAFAAGDGLDTADEYENDTRVTFWTEGRVTLFDDDVTDNGRFGVVHAGVDYLVNDRVLLGFSAQVDWLSQDNANNNGGLNGVGWLAGPTVTVQVQDNFYVDLTAALGQSYNDINPLGTYTDAFNTNRLFLSGGLIGDFEYGLYTILPSVSFSYIVEEQKAYTDSNAALVAAQTLSQGEVRFGPRVARTFALEGGDSLSTFAEFNGVYTFGDAGNYADGSLAADMIGFTGATELGATYATRFGLALTFAANYGGIGADASHYGGTVRIAMPLN